MQRWPITSIIFISVILAMGLYFAFSAVQGPSGILRRVQVEAEMEELRAERKALEAEVQEMRNLTRRLSTEYLDLDLLDERARQILGLIRADEAVIR